MQQSSPPTLALDNDNFNLETKNDNIPAVTCTKRLKDSRLNDGFVVNTSSLLQSAASLNSSQTQITAKQRIPIFPHFLLPGTFDEHLRKFRNIVAESVPARRFTPLMPPEIARRLIQNSFTEVMAEHPLMDLSTFVKLLDAQYTANSIDSDDNPARWAMVNAVTALAIRFKTAPGSEDALSDITHGLYQNATRVLPDLILQGPCLLSVQALLTMAMFARCVSDIRAFIMSATNASRQLELLTLNLLSTEQAIDMEEAQQYETVYRTVNTFDVLVLGILNAETTSRQAWNRLTVTNHSRPQPPISQPMSRILIGESAQILPRNLEQR